MKKIYLSVCLIFVLLLVSCSSSTHPFEQHLTILKEKFPDASITVENATLTMKQTVDFDSSSLPINENSCDYIVYDRLDDLKSDLKFMDSSEPNQEQIAGEVSSQIRNIVYSLQNKYQGSDVIEAKGITSVKFIKANKAIKFAACWQCGRLFPW